jgi:hypothetical protein
MDALVFKVDTVGTIAYRIHPVKEITYISHIVTGAGSETLTVEFGAKTEIVTNKKDIAAILKIVKGSDANKNGRQEIEDRNKALVEKAAEVKRKSAEQHAAHVKADAERRQRRIDEIQGKITKKPTRKTVTKKSPEKAEKKVTKKVSKKTAKKVSKKKRTKRTSKK